MEILNLGSLLPLLDEVTSFKRLASDIRQGNKNARASVIGAARSFVIAALQHNLQCPVLVVTSQAENARRLYDQLCIWNQAEQTSLLPEPDALPYERIVPDPLTVLDTLRVLSVLAGAAGSGKPPLVVASAHAFAMRQPPAREFAAAFHTIAVDMTIESTSLIKRWQSLGYQMESIVEVPGTMGRRGGIVDIYPPTSDLPTRIEFFGNTVESIRLFDPATQRSQHKINSVTVGPATTLFTAFANTDADEILSRLDFSACTEDARRRFTNELTALTGGRKIAGKEFYAPLFNQGSLFSYLPLDGLLILDEPLAVYNAVDDLGDKAKELSVLLEERGELPPGFPTPHITREELQQGIGKCQRLSLESWGVEEHGQTYALGFASVPGYAGQLPSFINRVKQNVSEKQRVVIVSHQSARLQELLGEQDIIAPPRTEIKTIPPSGSVTLVQGLLAGGWSLGEDTVLYTDAEIFGFTKVQRAQKKRPVARHKLFADIKPGDYVVHIEHGIAEFKGFTKLTTAGAEREYLVLQYAGGDNLYVPTDQVDRVTRYVGAGEQVPTLSRLGSQEWTRTKQKVKEATEEIARDLLQLYATREVVSGYRFSKDTLWQRELEASFPYVETPDQVTVLEQVKEDMEKTKPMDRLVCGDVGYGKTEVAVRAAFKAVMDGKQVAMLVPTTVLAQQHYLTFSQRMKAFPSRVEVLSRFLTPKEQKKVIEGLANGAVDICIGTHRLVQKDVKFKDLGLLIIDEEQRFGVQHKEFLKKMRQEVDVLTLSATPIPRTLHMALVGVRDMSTMETPPEDRLPIRTYLAEYDNRLIRESILREMERQGQVFFVHNRVETIGLMADRLRRLVPEARIAIAHGQMPEEQLERVTTEFLQGKSDVLLCTTIIESGLDMPNVNTLIVNRADKFGLTQLYQLRGRVGRGATLAYAYFLFDKGKRLTPIAEKRLRTIHEATELGAGFNIAMRDLEIRGAGTLLGERQSGHIAAVGFNLYSQLLAAAVENLKAQRLVPYRDTGAGLPQLQRPEQKLPPPSIDLPLPALIPDDYVGDIITRLSLYQCLADITDERQSEPFLQDLNDRFGPPPLEVDNLLYIVRIKALGAKAGIESISQEDDEIVLRLFAGMRFEQKKLAPFYRYDIKVGTSQLRFSVKQPGKGWQKVLEEILRGLEMGEQSG
ncbi:MAG: transcription-repair coupling factor [Dehalococcoidia bacterium]|nr:transcription-repair coupling factor [Dehalococcoidia bacterium]